LRVQVPGLPATITVVRRKTVLITGATSGIGRAAAEAIASTGARVLLVSRTRPRGQRTRHEIVARTGNPNVELLVANLVTRDAVRALAKEVGRRTDRLHVLVNNAAVLTATRKTTPEGFELQFFVNHLVYFMLTNLLVPLLVRSAPSRVVNVASTAHSSGEIHFDDLQMHHAYRGWKAYANSKLANILFTYELARRLDDTGVTANCVHPGVIHTGLLRGFHPLAQGLFNILAPFFKNPADGADTPVYVALAPELDGVTGCYFRDRKPLQSSAASRDKTCARELWRRSEELTGCLGDFSPP